MSDTPQGGCQCGAVRYRLKAQLPPAYACHCGECKKQSASAFSMSVALHFADLDVDGKVAVYETLSFSGTRKLACFCSRCGTRLWHRSSEASEWVTLKVGTLDNASAISPRGHLWVSKRQPWIAIPEGVPAFETQPQDVHHWRTNLDS